MNKIIVGIVLAAVLCFLGGPFATGLVAERGLRARVEAMNANNPWLAAEVLEYDRGWFSSDAVIELAIETDDGLPSADTDALPAALTAPVPIAIEIGHGPIELGDGLFIGIARVVAHPDPEAAPVSELTSMLGVPHLFELRGRSGFGGRFDFDAEVPAFTFPSDLGEVRFSGLGIEGFADGAEVTAEGAFEALGLTGGFAAGAIESVAFDLVFETRGDRLPVGSGKATIERAVASSPFMGNEPLFELAGFSLEQSVAVNGDALDGRVDYRSDRLVAGSDTNLSDVELSVRIAGLDRQAVADYYAVVDRALDTPALEPEQMMDELAPSLEALVRHGFTIEIEPAGFASELGTLDANMLVTVDGSSLPPAAPVDVRNIAVLLDVVGADADLTVTKALARDLAARVLRPQLAASGAATGDPFSPDELAAAADAQAGLMLATLAGQGMLDDDGTSYRMTLRFADGSLTVNGQALGPGFF